MAQINLLARTLPRFGVTTTFAPPRDHAAFAAAIRPETKLVLGETIGNPGLEVLDLERVADIAHSHGLPLVIDNTFATPWGCRPIDHGADVVMHSLTKWIGGHGLVIGGALVDGGKFDWLGSGRHSDAQRARRRLSWPQLRRALRACGFHHARPRRGPARFWRPVYRRITPRGCSRGVETLGLQDGAAHRERRRCAGGARRAIPPSHGSTIPRCRAIPTTSWREKLLPRGAGAIVTFGVRGRAGGGRARFIEACRLASHLANVGDAKTLVIHPASTTHRQMSAAELTRSGVGEDMVRLSVGLEAADDIVADLKQALAASQRG